MTREISAISFGGRSDRGKVNWVSRLLGTYETLYPLTLGADAVRGTRWHASTRREDKCRAPDWMDLAGPGITSREDDAIE